jgi:competence protein ComEC
MKADSASNGPSIARGPSGLRAVPMFHAAWLFAAGVAATSVLWLSPAVLLVSLALVAMLCAAAAERAQRVAWFPVAILWLLLGAWCAEMEPHPIPAPALNGLSDGLMRAVEGTVTDAGPVRGESEQNSDDALPELPTQRVDLRVVSAEVVTDDVDEQEALDGGVRLTIRWPAKPDRPFHCGERIRAAARLLPPAVYYDPGAWSRADFLLDQGITSTASLAIERAERLGDAPGAFLTCRISSWQRASSARLLALPAAMTGLPAPLRLSPDDAVMLAAMVTGDRTFLTHSLRVGFERTGSFHMLVVSGFHLAIVAGCFFWIAKRLRLPRVPATLVTIAASFAYAIFTGFATPVQRSLWMVTLYLLGRLVYRQRSPLNTIGFAALCLLAVSPRSLFESSFQMTLLAVVSIGGVAAPFIAATLHPYLKAASDLQLIAIDAKLAPPLAQFRVTLRMIAARLEAITSWRIAWRIFPGILRFGLRLGELLVVSCVVELAMTLPMAIYFHRITLVALPVNLLIMPLILALMPAALLTMLTQLLWPAAAVVPGMVAALLLHVGVGAVHLFGSFAGGDFRIPAPLFWQSIAFCVLLGPAIVLAHWPAGVWARRASALALFLAAFAAVAPRPVEHPRDVLLVEAIDVGQGDSMLIITPDGKTLLVDGGGIGGGRRTMPQEFDIGDQVVSPALWARGICHLDVVALSHAHSDHMGGLPAILRNFHPSELWVGNNPSSDEYVALLTEAANLKVKVRSLRAGEVIELGRTQVNVLAPFADYRPGPEPSNNDSLVLRASYGTTSVLGEGDAEKLVEHAMLDESGLASTLLKVGHHGAVNSTQPEFLARVAPQWAVISCGRHNHYGHPRQEVLAELQDAKVRTFRTDINGATCFRLDGKTASNEPCEAQHRP